MDDVRSSDNFRKPGRQARSPVGIQTHQSAGTNTQTYVVRCNARVRLQRLPESRDRRSKFSGAPHIRYMPPLAQRVVVVCVITSYAHIGNSSYGEFTVPPVANGYW